MDAVVSRDLALLVSRSNIQQATLEDFATALEKNYGDIVLGLEQQRFSFTVYCKNEEGKALLLENGITYGHIKLPTKDPTKQGTWITLEGINASIPNSTVNNVIKAFGEVITAPRFPLIKGTNLINTAKRVVEVKLRQHIPRVVRVVDQGSSHAFRAFYKDQPKQCFLCGQEDHLWVQCQKDCKHERHQPEFCKQAEFRQQNRLRTLKLQEIIQQPQQQQPQVEQIPEGDPKKEVTLHDIHVANNTAKQNDPDTQSICSSTTRKRQHENSNEETDMTTDDEHENSDTTPDTTPNNTPQTTPTSTPKKDKTRDTRQRPQKQRTGPQDPRLQKHSRTQATKHPKNK